MIQTLQIGNGLMKKENADRALSGLRAAASDGQAKPQLSRQATELRLASIGIGVSRVPRRG